MQDKKIGDIIEYIKENGKLSEFRSNKIWNLGEVIYREYKDGKGALTVDKIDIGFSGNTIEMYFSGSTEPMPEGKMQDMESKLRKKSKWDCKLSIDDNFDVGGGWSGLETRGGYFTSMSCEKSIPINEFLPYESGKENFDAIVKRINDEQSDLLKITDIDF